MARAIAVIVALTVPSAASRLVVAGNPPPGPARPIGTEALPSPEVVRSPEAGPRPRLVVQSAVVQTTFLGFTADGRHLISSHATDEGELVVTRVWEIGSGLEVRRFDGVCVGLTADRRAALIYELDATARLMTIPEGVETHRVQLDRRVQPLSLAPEGDAILVRRRGSEAAWIDLATGVERSRVAIDQGFQVWASSGPNGVMLGIDSDSKPILLDAASGQLRSRLESGEGRISRVALSPDGRLAAGCTLRGGPEGPAPTGWVYVWDVSTGAVARRIDYEGGEPASLVFSPDGLRLLGPGRDGVARLWDLRTGDAAGRFETGGYTPAAGFSADGRMLATSPSTRTLSDSIQLWDVGTGELERRLAGRVEGAVSASFEADGRLLAVSGRSVRIWDLERGEETLRVGDRDSTTAVFSRSAVSPDGRFLAVSRIAERQALSLEVWEIPSGTRLWQTSGPGPAALAFSPDGRLLALGLSGGAVQLQSPDSPRVLRTIEVPPGAPHGGDTPALAFSPDGRFLLIGGGALARLFDLVGGNEVYSIGLDEGERVRLSGTSVAISPDGRLGLSSMSGAHVVLWDLATGRELRRFPQEHPATDVAFSPDSRLALIYERRSGTRLVDVATGQDVRRFDGIWFRSPRPFSPDGRYLVTQAVDGSTRVWDVSSGEEQVRLVSFEDGTWAAVDLDGRFDASNGGDVEGMHWVVGLQPVALGQLKERYYDPGLLAKHLGRGNDTLRSVKEFAAPQLFPVVDAAFGRAGSADLTVRLANRGGGIGRVTVAINGKEVTADARGPGADPDAPELRLAVELDGSPFFIPGEQNRIEVRAYNAAGYLSSRGVELLYQPPEGAPTDRPTLWAVVAGVSDYEGESLDLRYAAKDARDMAKALSVGARRLFGADRVRTTLLASEADDASGRPTKANLERAFSGLAAASSTDVLVVYLAGHGLAHGEEYYFLTSEARSAELTDPAIRQRVAVSAEELVAWLKRSPASKQVMVLDTCAAGQAATRLVDRRDISSDQVRAIERLKDRTGFHVLMGSAADAVSYEASPFEQGLLTHALLLGMRGAALRNGEFVDVSTLFQYAADEVPDLARDIGGIQRPRIAAPKGTSFDIGQLLAEDRPAVPLATAKPVLLHPYLQSTDDRFDTLELTGRVRERLRALSHASRGRGGGLPVAYVDADQFAGAIRPSGDYAVREGNLTATVVLVRDGRKVGEIEATGRIDDLDAFADEVVRRLVAAAASARP